MRKRISIPVKQVPENDSNKKSDLPFTYPAKEDIYEKSQEVKINEDDTSAVLSGDLDVPGAELDDAQEIVGSEDEENNYYSIGGDNHDNLEEHNA